MSVHQEALRSSYRRRIQERLAKVPPKPQKFDWLKIMSYVFNAVFLIGGVIYFYQLNSESRKVKEVGNGLRLKGQVQTLTSQLEEELTTLHEGRSLPGRPVPMFKAKSFDLEVSFVLERTSSQGSKLDARMLTLEDKQTVHNQAVQKLILHMELVPPVSGHSGPAQ